VNESRLKLNAAAARLQAADASGCVRICNQLLQEQPGFLDAFYLRGISHAQLGNTGLAVADLSRLWSVQKGNLHAALVLGSQLRKAGLFDEAVEPLTAAVLQPEFEIDARYELARVLTRLRRAEEAINEYKIVLRRMPEHADAAANLAFLLERSNQLDHANQRADEALALQPGNFMAQLSKATIERRQGNIEAAQTRLSELLAQDLLPLNRSIVLNQMGQCLEQAEAWRDAFICFGESNSILRNHHPHGSPFDSGSYGVNTVRQIHHWLQANPPSRWSCNTLGTASDPTFLVGFPRSGTTLLDQALSAHADIEVMEEHEFLDEARRNWVDGGCLAKIPAMSEADIASARNSYLQVLSKRWQFRHRPVVVDKLPLNLVYLFLIHRLFPQSRILLMLRDPRDACLSCYFQAFDLQGAMPYFLDLQDTVRYYDQVMTLTVESTKAMSNLIMTVRYENLVNEFEQTMRQLIAFLGLDWDADILNYREKSRQRVISTPSYQQVTQPLYTRSIGRWQNYYQLVEPAFQSLGQWVEYFGYDANPGGFSVT
jgi:tetratricopeptide (TPR) repeat protein